MSKLLKNSLRKQQRNKKKEVDAMLKFIRYQDQTPQFEIEDNVSVSVNESVVDFESHVGSPLSQYNDNIASTPLLSCEPEIDPQNIICPEQFLQNWAFTNNITHVALKELLGYLRKYPNFIELPKDPRTLMKTPREVRKVEVSGGCCIYFNLRERILANLQSGYVKCNQPIFDKISSSANPLISLSVGVDGIPITRSSKKQFWPVLCAVDQSKLPTPFVAAIFYAETKPSNTDFLQPFIKECKSLEIEGILYNGKKYAFRVSKILADAPARSFLKSVNNHNSYSGCERCTQEGVWVGRVCYPYQISVAKTDSDFRNCNEPRSILLDLSLGLVSQVPLDYLHLVCLGVVRKLIGKWVRGKLPVKCSNAQLQKISDRFIKFRKYFPREIQRKPRSLFDINYFKGTEFRTILLYTGIPAFYGIVENEKFRHFVTLHVALYILLSQRSSENYWNSLANQFLHDFVKVSEKIYGAQFITYNVHSLLHVADDSLNFGSLDNCSTFPFESFMQTIKKIMRSKNLFLEQAFNRLSELQNFKNVDRESVNTRFDISSKTGNNCFMLKNGDIVLASKVTVSAVEEVVEEYKKFLVLEKVKEYPIDSRKIGVYYCDQLSNIFVEKITKNDVLFKYICLPFKKSFICIPLLHTIPL